MIQLQELKVNYILNRGIQLIENKQCVFSYFNINYVSSLPCCSSKCYDHRFKSCACWLTQLSCGCWNSWFSFQVQIKKKRFKVHMNCSENLTMMLLSATFNIIFEWFITYLLIHFSSRTATLKQVNKRNVSILL